MTMFKNDHTRGFNEAIARVIAVAGVVAASAGCQSGVDDRVGVIMLQVSATPSGIGCLKVNVMSSWGTDTKTFPLTAGVATTGSMPGLPLGPVNVEAKAFAGACSTVNNASVATWASQPISVTLVSGVPAQISLNMRPAGQIGISVDWNDGGVTTMPSPAAVLDGQQYLIPCGANQAFSDLVCINQVTPSICPQTNPFLTRGTINRDETVTFGGTPGTTYNVTLRVRGIVEPKHYMGGLPGTPANGTNYGWFVGGAPQTSGNYNVYMLGVSSPAQVYFMNSVNKTEAHFTYPIDYTVTVPIAAGAQVRFLASDSNCSTVRNCDETSIEGLGGMGQCHPSTIAGLTGIAQPFNGQFLVLNVVSVTP